MRTLYKVTVWKNNRFARIIPIEAYTSEGARWIAMSLDEEYIVVRVRKYEDDRI